MRVAICLSGQMRTFERCHPYLKKYVLEPLQPDVFIHTWKNSGVWTKGTNQKDEEKKITYDELRELYDPKKSVIEDFEDSYTEGMGNIQVPDLLKQYEPRHYKGAIPMFYKIWACNELKKEWEHKHHFQYDVSIRLRPDMIFFDRIPDKVLKDTNIIWFSHYAINPVFQASDKFAVSGSKNMDYYCSLWEHLEEYWQNPLGNGNWEEHRIGERLMKYHLKNQKTKTFFMHTKILRHHEQIEEPTTRERYINYTKNDFKNLKKAGHKIFTKWLK